MPVDRCGYIDRMPKKKRGGEPKKKRKRGGQPKPEHLRRDDSIRFRVTSEERSLIEEAAEKERLDLSSWLRALALRRAEEVLEE